MKISKQKIEMLMVTRGLSVSELAARTGLNAQSLAIIRRRGSCRIGTAGKLCAALGCTAADIMPDEVEDKTKESEV